jgi:hypothetical protein
MVFLNGKKILKNKKKKGILFLFFKIFKRYFIFIFLKLKVKLIFFKKVFFFENNLKKV